MIYYCAKCRQRYRTPEKAASASVKCPKCGSLLSPQAEAATPPNTGDALPAKVADGLRDQAAAALSALWDGMILLGSIGIAALIVIAGTSFLRGSDLVAVVLAGILGVGTTLWLGYLLLKILCELRKLNEKANPQ